MAVFEDPARVVILGYRAVLSLAGLITIIIGYWISQKRWDEGGSAAFAKAIEHLGDDYQVVDDETGRPAPDVLPQTPVGDGPVDPPQQIADDTENPTNDAGKNAVPSVGVPVEDLGVAAPIPKVMLAGTAIFAFSFLYAPKNGYSMYINGWNASAVLLFVGIGVLVGFPLRQAAIDRDAGLRRRTSVLVIIVYWVFAIMTWIDGNFLAPWYTLVFAGILYFLSYQLIRRSRKMGVTWDEEGKAAANVPTQNVGFVILFLASLLLWLGVNSVPFQYAEEDSVKIPLYSGPRTWIVFLAGPLIIVPSQLTLDRAFDEGATYNGGFGLSGDIYLPLVQRFPYFDATPIVPKLESPLFYLCGWALLALTQFMPFLYGFTAGRIISFLLCLITGSLYAFKVLPSYWTGYPGPFNKWNTVYCASFCALVLSVGVHHWISCVLAFAGGCMIVGGQYVDMFDRKRGYFWVNARNTNPRPSVFGIGQPMYIAGWIFLALAMSVPY